MKIYLARPINGQTYEEVVNYYNKATKELRKAGYEVFHPMTGKGVLRNEHIFRATGYDHHCSTNHAIFLRDQWMVHQSDVVFVNLCGSTMVSIGCVAEMAIARENGKHIVVAFENGNIHEHAFVLEMLSVRFEDYKNSIIYLKKLAKGQL